MHQVTQQDGLLVVTLGPSYEAFKPKELREMYESLVVEIDKCKPPKMVLDLSQTRFIDSTFLETMFRIWKRIKQRQGDMAICGLDENCAKVLEVTRLDTIWTIRPTVEEAVAHLKSE